MSRYFGEYSMNTHFQKEIDNLKKKILRQCAIVEENLSKAVLAVSDHDEKAAQSVLDQDPVIDQNEIEIEEECLKLLALYQPVATDLRYVVVCLKVNNDLERIGDLSCNIAERVATMKQGEEQLPARGSIDFDEMITGTQKMLKDALDSLIRTDSLLALDVIKRDDVIDRLNAAMHDKVNALIQSDPVNVAVYITQLSVSKQLERIADIATNICEDVIYMATGNIVRHADS